ncbi:MAG: hypothetical protein AVDCRST_MAG08-2619, partial [uncultured Acetobacteraceae bacterium]
GTVGGAAAAGGSDAGAGSRMDRAAPACHGRAGGRPGAHPPRQPAMV